MLIEIANADNIVRLQSVQFVSELNRPIVSGITSGLTRRKMGVLCRTFLASSVTLLVFSILLAFCHVVLQAVQISSFPKIGKI